MKNRISTLFLIAVVGLMIGCDAAVVSPSEAPLVMDEASAAKAGTQGVFQHEAGTQGVLQHELAQVRRATARYRNVQNALDDDYAIIIVDGVDLCVTGQGCHYLKEVLVDGTFDPENPEILLYAPNPHSGHLRLVGVEYAVPDTELEPSGFTGDQDVWELTGEPFNLWVLHAWVWQGNPNGVFADTNPHVP